MLVRVTVYVGCLSGVINDDDDDDNFDTRKRILILSGSNVADKVGNQQTLYYATPNNLCLCTTWQNGKTRKLHSSLKCCISALSEFKSSLLHFFNHFDS